MTNLNYKENNRDSPFARHSKKCWSFGIIIEVEASVSGLCKINVLQNGEILVKGEKYFTQKPSKNEVGLHEKVAELYECYYNKIIEYEITRSI